MSSFKFRSRLALFAVLTLASACSDDDSGDGGSGNAANSAGNAGSGGEENGGNAGTTMSNAGAGGGDAMYSAAEACERFAEVTCDKGAECGLVTPLTFRPCLAPCDALVIGIIANECESSLGGPRNAADVDRCIDSIADNSCEQTCSGAPFDGCEAFAELPSGGGVGVECDEQCL